MLTAIIVPLLMILIGIKIPIAIAMGATAVVYFSLAGMPMETIVQKAFGGVNSFEMTAIPLFMLAGELMNVGGISSRLIKFGLAFLGHMRGGMGMATVLACMIFGGASGSTLAEIAAIGPITIPAMAKQGYSRSFAAAIVGVSSELGPIIPPSIIMVVTASLAQVSTGKMLLSGMGPGILIGIGLLLVVYVISVKRGYPAERQPKVSIMGRLEATKDAFWALLMQVILIGGMLVGVFTPTEAAAVAVIYAIVVGKYIHKDLELKSLWGMFHRTAVSCAGIMFVIGLANLYGYMLTRERIGVAVANGMMGISDSTQVVLLILLAILVPLGMLLSSTPVVMLIVPVLVPLVGQLGADPIHFFSVITLAALIGTLTPPVALGLYLASRIAGTKPMETFKEMVPLIAVIYGVIILGIFIPEILTIFPDMAYGK